MSYVVALRISGLYVIDSSDVDVRIGRQSLNFESDHEQVAFMLNMVSRYPLRDRSA